MELFRLAPFEMTDDKKIKKISRYIVEDYDMNNHKKHDIN